MNAPKVMATVFGAVAHKPGDAQGVVRVVVEWVITSGAHRSGKFEAVMTQPRSRSDVRLAVIDQLTASLATQFQPEVFRNRDVLLFGV